MSRLYAYVGPPEILARVQGQPPGTPIYTPSDLRAWLPPGRGPLTATYTVGADRVLRLADRHSEHVACAGFQPVRAAGELTVDRSLEVTDISNQSTGFCPEPACWSAVAESLDAVPLQHPGRFTAAFDFRRCERCGQRTLVKDDWFVCVCGAPLPAAWNFGYSR